MHLKLRTKVSLLIVLVLSFLYLISVVNDKTDKRVEKYLNKYYIFEYALLSTEKNGDNTICKCVTNDENSIEFNVTIRNNRLNTVWGNIYFPGQYMISDDFPEKLSKYVWDESKVIDISNMTEIDVENKLGNIIDNLNTLEKQYDVDAPSIVFKVNYKGKNTLIGMETRGSDSLKKVLIELGFGL